jgi:NAD-dependent SIR2 family protein deacetylase
MRQISVLIGAGFSANYGYPIGNKLNEKILKLKDSDFCIGTEGSLCLLQDGKEDPFYYSSYFTNKMFFLEFVDFYRKIKTFHYEDFYDDCKLYMNSENKEFNNFYDDFKSRYSDCTDKYNMLSQSVKILNQLVSIYLVDKYGNKYYHKAAFQLKPYFEGYTGFLNWFEEILRDSLVHVHTLNHDLFFERLNSTEWLGGDLTDGFVELGSPYYGKLDVSKVRLAYFADDYKSNLRLYKLHGSIDQYPFHINGYLDKYVKIKWGVGTTDLYKEIKRDNGEFEYINDWINYHSDFLTGTTSKILRYQEPFYEHLFKYFENNLSASDELIIIGYSARDSEVNEIIERKFDYKNKPIKVINPFPDKIVEDFCSKFNAKLLKLDLNSMKNEDMK